MSKRSAKYWTRLEDVVNEKYKRYLTLSPVEKLKVENTKVAELEKEEYSRVKAIIMETLLKSIPKELATEATQKRLEEPNKVMLMIMLENPPGSKKEKEMLLHKLQTLKFVGQKRKR